MNSVLPCFLNNINNLHEPIKLFHNQEIILGRGPLTKISDKRCSRNQVSVNYNSEASEVCVKQKGENSSAINGLALRKDEVHTLHHGDRLELLFGEHIYEVKIAALPPQSNGKSVSPPKRAKIAPPSSSVPEPSSSSVSSGAFGLFTKPLITKTGKWESFDNDNLLVYTPSGLKDRNKIASYDLDHTVITTKTGNVFPKDINDWRIAYSEVPGKIKQLWNDGFKIVFFTNQGGIKKGKLRPNDFKKKVNDIITKLGVPVQILISTGSGIYRKPAPGMWDTLTENMNGGVKVDLQNSFYCGDAAGRENGWAPKKKKDFSCSDRLFAMNIGLKFVTPEEHFLEQRPVKFSIPKFNPSSFPKNIPLYEPPDAVVASKSQEVVVLVGYPGSGKSFFAEKYLVPAGYQYVNRDKMGSWQKCVATMEEALTKGQSVVIDNTNPDRDSRRKFVEIANKLEIACRCFAMAASKELAKHNNRFRELTDDTHQKISEVIINMYGTKFQEPTVDEGFKEIVKVNFVPSFKNAKLEKLYDLYLLDKY